MSLAALAEVAPGASATAAVTVVPGTAASESVRVVVNPDAPIEGGAGASGDRHVLRSGEAIAIPPAVLHHVEPDAEARFAVEFHR